MYNYELKFAILKNYVTTMMAISESYVTNIS